MGPETFETVISSTADLKLEARGKGESGGLLLVVTMLRIRVEMSDPAQGTVRFDTADPKLDTGNPAALVQRGLAGQPIRVFVGSRGDVLGLTGFRDAIVAALDTAPTGAALPVDRIKASVSDESAVPEYQMLFAVLPPGPAGVGDTWSTGTGGEPEEGQPDAPVGKLVAADAETASIETRGTFEREDDGLPGLLATEQTITARISRADGLPLELRFESSSTVNNRTQMGIVPAVVTKTMELKRVAPPPKGEPEPGPETAPKSGGGG